MEEVEIANAKAKQFRGFRMEAMDVTKLAWLRPDGHPGAYYKNLSIFANRVPKHVQNDCVHWCLQAPIDTWNEIFLEMMKKWWYSQEVNNETFSSYLLRNLSQFNIFHN